MSYIGPYWQANDFSHMYSNRFPIQPEPVNNGSIMSVIDNIPNMQIFKKIIDISKLRSMLSSVDGNTTFTLLAPTDEYFDTCYDQVLADMSILTARDIVMYSLLLGKIPYNIFKSSRSMTYPTKNTSLPVMVHTINNNVYINGGTRIINGNIECQNGIIHQTDSILYMEAYRKC